MNFIELTMEDNSKFIGNVALLKRVFTDKDGKTCIVGWSNNGAIEVKESYEAVITKINANLATVNRF